MSPRIRALRPMTALLATPLLLAGLSACGDAEELVGNAARSAGCSAAEQVVSPIRGQVRAAVEDLGADPEAARRELTVLRNAVDAAAGTLSGEARQALGEISAALETLTEEARVAARSAVDQQAVQQAQDELGAAIDEFGAVC